MELRHFTFFLFSIFFSLSGQATKIYSFVSYTYFGGALNFSILFKNLHKNISFCFVCFFFPDLFYYTSVCLVLVRVIHKYICTRRGKNALSAKHVLIAQIQRKIQASTDTHIVFLSLTLMSHT